MLSKTSRKDVAMDKASDLASAVADAAEGRREKIAPAVGNVAGQLSVAADKASAAAAPHVAKAKVAAAEAAAPHVSRAKGAAAEVAGAAAPRGRKARKAAKKAAKNAAKNASKSVVKAKAKATAAGRAEAAGLTKEQVHRLFADEWMPRIQETIAATTAAGTQAYAALPQQARDAVEVAAPQMTTKRRKKGTVLITLGLLAGAGAVALYLSGQQKGDTSGTPPVTAPEIERLDVNPVETSSAVPASDDAVGDLEKTVDTSVTGSRRGRHAAGE